MGGLKWTDDDLRRAVDKARSWRGVLRHLGLNSSSGGSLGVVKRAAQRLDLDTSHFTGTRQWSDRELTDAIANSSSWNEAAGRIGLSPERRTEIKLKGHAIRLGLDVAHLEPLKPPRPSVEALQPEPKLSELRTAVPAIITSWFAIRGVPVAVPSEPQEYDLLVTAPSRILRVQVKSSTYRTSSGTWHVGIGHRPYSLDKTAGKMPYDPETLDLFAIINGDGEIYLIPIEVIAGRTGIYLSAYKDYKVGDASSLLN